MKRAKLIGTCDSRCVLPPASSSRTRKRPFSVRRLASAEPADPAPTMMKSTVRWSMAASPQIVSAATCANDTIEDAGCREGNYQLPTWAYARRRNAEVCLLPAQAALDPVRHLHQKSCMKI